MKNALLFLSFLFCGHLIIAQNNTITLHPVVGDSIDQHEVEKFLLFDEFETDGIDCLVLEEEIGNYFLLGIQHSTTVFRKEVSEDQLLAQIEKIEKLNRYFTSVNEKDSLPPSFRIDSTSLNQIDLNFKTREFYKTIEGLKRQKFHQEKASEKRVNHKRGMLY